MRFTISKRILEIYASRNIVVNGHHDAIPPGHEQPYPGRNPEFHPPKTGKRNFLSSRTSGPDDIAHISSMRFEKPVCRKNSPG